MKLTKGTVALVSGISVLVVIALLVLLVFRPLGTTTIQTSIICQTGIEAGLTQGPDAPLDLSGDLKLNVNSDNTFTGTLTLKKDGKVVNVKGMGAGTGIDMVFDAGNGTLLFAHGSQENPIWDCKGFVGGPLTGPHYGDMGDWTNYPPYIRVISGTRSIAPHDYY
jgi:hypothetical protein